MGGLFINTLTEMQACLLFVIQTLACFGVVLIIVNNNTSDIDTYYISIL